MKTSKQYNKLQLEQCQHSSKLFCFLIFFVENECDLKVVVVNIFFAKMLCSLLHFILCTFPKISAETDQNGQSWIKLTPKLREIGLKWAWSTFCSTTNVTFCHFIFYCALFLRISAEIDQKLLNIILQDIFLDGPTYIRTDARHIQKYRL